MNPVFYGGKSKVTDYLQVGGAQYGTFHRSAP